jgi:CHAT domain-containing protein
MRQRETNERGDRTGRSRVALIGAAAIGVVVASSVLALHHRRRADDLVARVADAAGAHRVVRARLTGGYSYAPCRAVANDDSLVTGLTCTEAPASTWPEFRALGSVAAQLRAGAVQSEGRRHHATGSWNVIWSNPGAAVQELEEAARLEPKNAAVHADLGVALLQRAELAQDPVAIFAAYAATDSALALAPRNVEAMFNRALILEKLYLTDLARAQWKAYLVADRDSPWAAEARERLAALELPPPRWADAQTELARSLGAGDTATTERLVKQFAWRVRDDVRLGLTAWGRAYNAGDAKADSLADVSLALARALAKTTRDAFWFDVARDVLKAAGRSDRARARQIAEGLVAYDRGRSELDRFHMDSARRSLDRAHALLTRAGNPAVHLVEYERARVSYQGHSAGAYADARRRWRNLAATVPPEYRFLRALSTRNVGLIGQIENKLDLASASYGDAIGQGVGLVDPVLALRMRQDVARLVAQLRGDSAALKEAYATLRALPSFPDRPFDAQLVFGTGADLSRRRFPQVAPLFQGEVARLAGMLNDSVAAVSAHIQAAQWLAQERRADEAAASLRMAEVYSRGIHNDSIKAVYRADADLVLGQMLLEDRPDSAVRLLSDVVDRYDKSKNVAQIGRAKLLLADAYVNAGRFDSARVAFDSALATIEQARAELGNTEDRARLLDEARPVIDSVLTFYLNRSDTLGALDFLEKMRARVLLERSTEAVPNDGDRYRAVSTLRSGLDPATSIISYAVMDNAVVGWLVRRDGVWMRRVATSEALEPLVDRFVRLVKSGTPSPEIEALSARLRQTLIDPFEDRIPEGSSLVIVPDKWLHFVPFAALFDRRRHRFLVQAYELGVAPSIRLFADAAARARVLSRASNPSVLAVGNPAFDRAASSLPLLPGAEREAREVAQRYPRRRLLIGREATRRTFLEQVKSANIVHFAGHAVVSLDAPMFSQLMLAPDAQRNEPGAVYAKDLFAMSLPATRLAILSGCQTAGGGLSATEGVSSLARSLLAAGVPAVIASLWAVDDEATATFFAAYHDDFSRSGEADGALRRTQVAWIARGDAWRTARTWAAFQMFGTVDTPESGSYRKAERLAVK